VPLDFEAVPKSGAGDAPAIRPEDQEGFDEAMKIGYRGVRELLERRRRKP
jgi:hypothetical protein